MLLVEAILYATLFLLSVLAIRRIGRRRHSPSPPGPVALPIIGHLHLLGPRIHRSFDKLSRRYGPLMFLRIGSIPCVVASSPDMAKEFLKTHELTFSSRMLSSAIKIVTYESGFAFAPYGSYTKFIKKLCVHELLSARSLHHFEPARTMEIHHFLQILMNKAKSGETLNISKELQSLTGNVVSQMMLSIRCSETEGEAEEVRSVIRGVTQIFGEFDVSDCISFLRKMDLQGIKKRAKDIHKRFDALLEKVISQKERARKTRAKEVHGGDTQSKDLLDMLLDIMESDTSEVKITRKHLKALILDFFTAGTDTSSIAIEWAAAELLNNPRVLQKAREEIDNVVGTHRLVEESDTSNLPYIQAITKETFRLHPPIPTITRFSHNECMVAGYKIPAGSMLFVNAWSIGRNPKYWDNPLEFRPERFLEPGKQGDQVAVIDIKGQNFELLPFGTGRRGCPGMLLAMQEMQTVIAAMVQCFDWKVPGFDGNGGGIDMTEQPGLSVPRANNLICLLEPRFDPFATTCDLIGKA